MNRARRAFAATYRCITKHAPLRNVVCDQVKVTRFHAADKMSNEEDGNTWGEPPAAQPQAPSEKAISNMNADDGVSLASGFSFGTSYSRDSRRSRGYPTESRRRRGDFMRTSSGSSRPANGIFYSNSSVY
jgi:hypothetical protein